MQDGSFLPKDRQNKTSYTPREFRKFQLLSKPCIATILNSIQALIGSTTEMRRVAEFFHAD
jgi:hypothetical protein